MNAYQITIEGDTELWLAKSLPKAIKLSWANQLDLNGPEDEDQITELRRWFDEEGLESVVWIGEVANPS